MFRLIGCSHSQPIAQVLRETLKTQRQSLHRAFLHIQNVIDRDAKRPRFQLTVKIELREARNDAHQNLLRSVFCVFTIAQHTQSQALDVALQATHQLFKRIPISVNCTTRCLFERDYFVLGLRHNFYFPHSTCAMNLANFPGS
jgi:hypothetical protein